MESNKMASTEMEIFAGHTGTLQSASCTVANRVIGGLETLCGQAFGEGRSHMLGVYMQPVMCILKTGRGRKLMSSRRLSICLTDASQRTWDSYTLSGSKPSRSRASRCHQSDSSTERMLMNGSQSCERRAEHKSQGQEKVTRGETKHVAGNLEEMPQDENEDEAAHRHDDEVERCCSRKTGLAMVHKNPRVLIGRIRSPTI
eukprot:Gb_12341 [translate_table: standard]